MWLTIAVAWLLAALAAYFFVLPTSGGETSIVRLRDLASWWLILQVLIVPILSMRLLSEEKRSGTIEALMTAPVADHEVVLGKFLAVERDPRDRGADRPADHGAVRHLREVARCGTGRGRDS